MSRIAELCDQILDNHRRLRRPVCDSFSAGLADFEIDERTSTLPFVLPRSVRELYKWRDGVPWQAGLDRRLFQSMEMWPIADTVAEYNMKRETHGDAYFPSNWFPIFNDEYCDAWVVNCSTEKRLDSEVIAFFNEIPNDKVAFRSVERMLMTMLAMFEQEVFSDDDGRLDTDYGKFRAVGAQMNPDAAAFWCDPESPYGPATA